jgi:hypothetical protein
LPQKKPLNRDKNAEVNDKSANQAEAPITTRTDPSIPLTPHVGHSIGMHGFSKADIA